MWCHYAKLTFTSRLGGSGGRWRGVGVERELTRNEKWCIWHMDDEVVGASNLSAIDRKSQWSDKVLLWRLGRLTCTMSSNWWEWLIQEHPVSTCGLNLHLLNKQERNWDHSKSTLPSVSSVVQRKRFQDLSKSTHSPRRWEVPVCPTFWTTSINTMLLVCCWNDGTWRPGGSVGLPGQ